MQTQVTNAQAWNSLLGAILTAIDRHFLHARILKYQGHVELADYEYRLSIESMRQADLLIEHILSQGNMPKLQKTDDAEVATTSKTIIETSMQLASDIATYAEKLLQETKADNGRQLLETLLRSLKDQMQSLKEWQKRESSGIYSAPATDSRHYA